MSYSIIGFGKIGHALAKAFARNGIEVSVATTRDQRLSANRRTNLTRNVAQASETNMATLGGLPLTPVDQPRRKV